MRCFAAQRIASAARSTPPRRFEEAFALIKKAWTVPGPFRWEGKHYHLRVVNPWQFAAAKAAPADLGGRHLEPGDDPLGGKAAHHLSRSRQRSRRDRRMPRDLA